MFSFLIGTQLQTVLDCMRRTMDFILVNICDVKILLSLKRSIANIFLVSNLSSFPSKDFCGINPPPP